MTAPLDDHLQRLAPRSRRCCRSTFGTEPAKSNAAGEAPTATAEAAPQSAKKAMFQEIMNFAYQRTTKQAIGWYLMYLVICVVMGFASGTSPARSVHPPARSMSAWPPGRYRRFPTTSRLVSCCCGIATRARRTSCSCSECHALDCAGRVRRIGPSGVPVAPSDRGTHPRLPLAHGFCFVGALTLQSASIGP